MEDYYCDECQVRLWKAGEVAPAGIYVRVDDRSYRVVKLKSDGYLPPSFDAHVALYCASPCLCHQHALNRPAAQVGGEGSARPLSQEPMEQQPLVSASSDRRSGADTPDSQPSRAPDAPQ